MLLKRTSLALVLGMIAALVLSFTGPAGAVVVANGCLNTAVGGEYSGVSVDLSGSAPATVAPGGSFQLSSIQQTLFLPALIFIAGYNLGLLQEGLNNVPGTIADTIEATNTVQGAQSTNTVNVQVSFTIDDPDNTPGSGDETATDAEVSNSFADMTWTAGASGTIEFREDWIQPAPATPAGGVRIVATVGGFLVVKFACSPGTVDEVNNIYTPQDPAASFASTSIEAAVNDPPTASAGSDQSVVSGAAVTLNGSGSSDPDADPLSYAWTQVSGPAVSLTGASTVSASFTAPTGSATLEFQLEVCDPAPLCDTDNTIVNVIEEGVNYPPTANAGTAQTVASGAAVTLNGSGSSDPNGDPLTYAWSQLSGTQVSLSGANTASASFTAPTGPATLEFQLQVCDAEPLCDTDNIVVNVSAPPQNHAPTANAGSDQTVASGAPVTLSGSASSDPDDDTLTYAWSQVSGSSVTLTGGNTASAGFSAPTGPATLTFELEVCDAEPLCDNDNVVVSVTAPPTVGPPFIQLDPTTVTAGGQVRVLAGGFMPDSDVDLFIVDPDTFLLTPRANEEGEIDAVVTIPSDIPGGKRSIVAIGVDPDEDLITLEANLNVVAVKGFELSGTGTALVAPLLGVSLGSITVGTVLLLLGRRRRYA